MRKLLILIALFISCKLSAQVYQVMPQYGYQTARMRMDSVLIVPGDTVRNKTGVVRIGTKLYAGNGSFWSEQGAGSTPTLQQVTTAGDTTNKYIKFKANGINRVTINPFDTWPLKINNQYNNESTIIDAGDIVTNSLSLLGFQNSSRLYLKSFSYQPSNSTLKLPITAFPPDYYERTLAISVNNNFADSMGNISISEADSSIYLTTFRADTMRESIYTTINNIQIVDSNTYFTTFRADTMRENIYTNMITTGSDASLKSLTITGTNGAGHIHLRHQASLPTATGQSTVIYADSNGDLAWKNDGDTRTTLKTSQNQIDRIYTFQDKDYTVADSADLALKANTAGPTFTDSLRINSTTGGLLIPRLTTTQRDAISSPSTGLLIFNTTTGFINQYNGTNWQPYIAPASNGLISYTGTTQTGSSANGALSLEQTWNTTGTINLINANVTNTASNSNSSLMNLSVASSSVFRVFARGVYGLGSGGSEMYVASATGGSGTISNNNLGFYNGTATNDPSFGSFGFSGTNITGTSGTFNLIHFNRTFAPISGSASYNIQNVISTINQTGTASGITRGIYINPTLTSAADFRAIETTRGRVVLGDNYAAGSGSLAGSLLDMTQTWNTTGNPTAIKLNVTNTSSGRTANLMDLQVGGNSRFAIDDSAKITLFATNTAAGTTGNQTINRPTGTVNIAAAGTSVTVTNNLVTANSLVFAVIRTNDSTAVIKNIVPGAGTFTINLDAAATAETSIGFWVIN